MANRHTTDSTKRSKRSLAGQKASFNSQCPKCGRKSATHKVDLFGYRKQRVCRYCDYIEPLTDQ